MHVPVSPVPRFARPPFAAAVVAMFASVVGVANAVEFDEKVKAPMAKDAAELRARAQILGAGYASLKEATPHRVMTDVGLFAGRFELEWQLQQALNEKRTLDGLADIGVTRLPEGGFSVDETTFPFWRHLDRDLLMRVKQVGWEQIGRDLTQRGFRDADVAVVQKYVTEHDFDLEARRATLPISLAFSRTVKKFDQIKRPVPDSLVLSYVYQRARAQAAAERAWSEGLFAMVDAQRSRILASYANEGTSATVILPDDQASGIAEILANMRLPDFDQRARAEAGVSP
jgi:hypothetical protein